MNHGLAPGRKRAYLLYQEALKDVHTISSDGSTEDVDGPAHTKKSAPHPYTVALGVLSIQKVLICIMCGHCNQIHQHLQYINDSCSSTSLSEFKAMLDNRHEVRLQITEDLMKKR